ncbi:MAG: ComEA family DNA-binding protein, partial [Planctomycetota bacterium]
IGPPEVDKYENDTIGEVLEDTRRADEYDIRLDLENPYHRNIFQYLTVFDPTTDGVDNDGDDEVDHDTYDDKDRSEWKIPGRININTAPWYVIKQLPWVSGKLAQAIVAYRDKLDLDGPVNYQSGRWDAIKNELDGSFSQDDIREDEGFASIGELNFVIDDDEYSIAKHALDDDELAGFPDLTTDRLGGGDGVRDDFEERDIIFSRISNLVTVRSDVFTAYILVRIGADGPQKRVIAILDRSNVYTGNGKVRIVAQHFVPDPR